MLLVIISLKVLSCVKLCCVKKQISLLKSFVGNLIPQNFDSQKKRKEKKHNLLQTFENNLLL